MALTREQQRDQIDMELSAALARVLQIQAEKLRRQLGDPPSIEHPTEHYWHALERQLLEELMPSLEEAYYISALHESRIWNYEIDLEQIRFEAKLWAARISEPIAREFVVNTKARLSDSLAAAAAVAIAHQADEHSAHRILEGLLEELEAHERHVEERKAAEEEAMEAGTAERGVKHPTAETVKRRVGYSEKLRREAERRLKEEATQMQNEEAARAVSTLYNEGRAASVAVTAVTKATTDGQQIIVSLVERDTGKKLKGFWKAQPGACDVCAPLDGKGPEVWGRKFPSGPPGPHPHCKCTLVYQVVYDLQGAA